MAHPRCSFPRKPRLLGLACYPWGHHRGIIVILNFRALRLIFESGFSDGKISGSLFVKYAIKFLAVLAAVAGVVFLLHGVVNLVAFFVGLLTIFVAISVVGIRGYCSDEEEKSNGA